MLSAFEGRSPFVKSILDKVEQLQAVYGMDYGAENSHRMIDEKGEA